MNNPATKNIYFSNLDAWRFFSFLGVFITHTLLAPIPSFGFKGFLFSIATLDCLMVPFFFTLSSFLITYRLLQEKEITGKINIIKFYRNRILRIWPPYFLLIITCFVFIPLVNAALGIPQPNLPAISPFLFFYANFYIIAHGSAFTFSLVILWSISIEEQFYLVWCWLLKFIELKWFYFFLAVVFAGSILFSYSYIFIAHHPATDLTIHSFFILQNFCTGAAIAYTCSRKKKIFALLEKTPAIIFILPYLILIFSNYFIKEIITCNVIKTICYSIIIYDQTFNTKRIFNAGKIPFINYLGKISYGLYLYHAVVFVVLQKQLHLFNYSGQYFLSTNLWHMTIAFIITFLISHLSYKFIETKFLALKAS